MSSIIRAQPTFAPKKEAQIRSVGATSLIECLMEHLMEFFMECFMEYFMECLPGGTVQYGHRSLDDAFSSCSPCVVRVTGLPVV